MNAYLKYFPLFIIWYPFRSVLRKFTTRRDAYHRLLKIGDYLGVLFYLVFPLGRKIIEGELQALGLYDQQVARKTFQHIMKVEMEGMVFEDLNRTLVEKITVFRGLRYLDEAIKMNKGVVLSLFHFGWHMHTIPALGYMGYTIKQIADPNPVDLSRELNPFHRKVIEKRMLNSANLPAQFLPAGNYLRPVMRALEENSVLIVALDGRQAKSFQPYSFLGKRILLSPLILRVAQKTGSPVLPMLTYRGEDGRHRVILHPPLHYSDADSAMAEILAIFEPLFQEKPHQYAHYILANCLAARDKERRINPLLI